VNLFLARQENFPNQERKMTSETFHVITRKIYTPGKKFECKKHFQRAQETFHSIQRNFSPPNFLLGQCTLIITEEGSVRRNLIRHGCDWKGMSSFLHRQNQLLPSGRRRLRLTCLANSNATLFPVRLLKSTSITDFGMWR